MANLLDIIRGNTQQTTQPQQMTDETQGLAGLLRARSGKAVGPAPVAVSQQQEAGAVAETNQQLQPVRQQAQIQQAGLEQQQASQTSQQMAQEAEVDQTRKFNTIQNQLKTNEILSDLERRRGEIDVNRDIASMEQLGATLRLQNKQYVDNLQREGARARINDGNSFAEEYTRAAFDNGATLSSNDRLNKAIVNQDDREFQKQLAQMGIDDAWGMFRDNQRAAQDQARWGMFTTAIGAGAQGYGAYQDKQANDQLAADKKSYYTTGGGANTNTFEASQARK
jgi:hypothetical protein